MVKRDLAQLGHADFSPCFRKTDRWSSGGAARGMTTREIQGHLAEMYGVDVSPALISDVTDGVIEEVKAWQNRPRPSSRHNDGPHLKR